MTEKRHPLTDEDIDRLACTLTEKMTCQHGCPLTEEDVSQVKDLLKIKKGTRKAILVIISVIFMWILKDLYDLGASIFRHLTIVRS